MSLKKLVEPTSVRKLTILRSCSQDAMAKLLPGIIAAFPNAKTTIVSSKPDDLSYAGKLVRHRLEKVSTDSNYLSPYCVDIENLRAKASAEVCLYVCPWQDFEFEEVRFLATILADEIGSVSSRGEIAFLSRGAHYELYRKDVLHRRLLKIVYPLIALIERIRIPGLRGFVSRIFAGRMNDYDPPGKFGEL
ncbi:MAG: hypothetical protein NUW37_03105 [Planctomycetes bacterium]|nr:hypothetical protein [Planctomycetota bacterium]